MSNQITVIEDINGRYACQYDWDTKHLDTSEIQRIKKLLISDEQLRTIKECTLDRVEEILSKLLN